MKFKKLGLRASILKAVDEKGYIEASPVQEKAIPLILRRKDVLASAQTGTGKTAGFTLPILHILSQNNNSNHKKIRALILTPTRELAAQIHQNVLEYSRYINIRSAVIFGGVNQKPQVSKIRNGVDILIATPGRLLDLENQRLLSLGYIEILVLDEATSALDNSTEKEFMKSIEEIRQDKTIIVVAHRLSTVRNCDKLYKLKSGKVLVEGPPSKLIKL